MYIKICTGTHILYARALLVKSSNVTHMHPHTLFFATHKLCVCHPHTLFFATHKLCVCHPHTLFFATHKLCVCHPHTLFFATHKLRFLNHARFPLPQFEHTAWLCFWTIVCTLSLSSCACVCCVLCVVSVVCVYLPSGRVPISCNVLRLSSPTVASQVCMRPWAQYDQGALALSRM